jgi:rubrerythrin
LKELIEIWRDDEKRHHRALKELANKTYFRLGSNDMVALFRDEKFLEGRYKSAKKFKENKALKFCFWDELF